MTATEQDTIPQDMSPAEYADLVRDAHAVIDVLERVAHRSGAVFVLASVAAFGALLLNLEPVATVTATTALLGFGAGLIATVARIALGDAPPLPEEASTEVAQVAIRPATGSATATPRNGGIPPK